MNVELERAQYLTAAVLVHLDQLLDGTFLVRSILGHFNYQPDPYGEDVDLSSLEEMTRIFETLEKLGYVYGYHDRYSEPRYEFTDKGSAKVAEESGNKDSLVHRYKKFGKPWLGEVLEGISSTGSSSGQGDEWLLEEDRPTVSDTPAHKPRFTEFRDALITALYEKSNEEGLNVHKLKELADERNISYRDGWIDEVSNFLNDHGYALVRKSMLGDENAVAKLNASGLEYVEKLIAKSERELAIETSPRVPASDRVVTLDDNSVVYKETLSTLERLTQDASKSNEFANLFANPEDKIRTLGEIDSGIQLLKNARVRPTAVYELLVNSLKWIAKKLPDVTLGALASRALDGLAKLLGF